MIQCCGFLVVEKRDEVQFKQIKGDLRMCGGIISAKNLPQNFPCCYRRVEAFDSHFCDSWVPCDIRECIKEYKDWLSMHHNQLKKLEKMI